MTGVQTCALPIFNHLCWAQWGCWAWDHLPGRVGDGVLGDGGAFDHRLQGSRRGYAHFPERTIETQRDSVVLEATYLRSCS